MQQLDKIFYGITPSEHRKILRSLFENEIKNRPNIAITTCGEFHLVKTAIEAGIKPTNIYASDISLYSSVLGYFFSGKKMASLKIKLREDYQELYDKQIDEVHRASCILIIMKLQQFKEKVYYEAQIKKEINDNKQEYIDRMVKRLEKSKEVFKGIHYEIKDLRDELVNEKYDKKWILTCDPPMYSGDYQKMFDFGDALVWDNGIKEFDLKEEYKNLFNLSRKQKYLGLWLKYKELDEMEQKYVFYVIESKKKYDYWLTTKPQELKQFIYNNLIKYKKPDDFSGVKRFKLLNDEDELKPTSEVRFVNVDRDTALYYRDLLVHRLGTVDAQHYFLILINGKLFSVVGINTGDVTKLRATRAYQIFGMTVVLNKYRKTTRLMMYFLTSIELKKVLIRVMSNNKNRIYDLAGIKSTSFTRFGRDKTNANLLKKVSKEKQKDGLYKIQYESDFYHRNFQQSLSAYLEEQKNDQKK